MLTRERINDLGRLQRLALLCTTAKEASYAAVSVERRGLPAAGSVMESDMATCGEGTAGQLQRYCGMWMEAAADCLYGLGAIYEHAYSLLAAPAPLQRAVLEHAAYADWIVSGDDPWQRTRRAFLAGLHCAQEDARTAELDPSGRVLSGARDRLDQLHEVTIPGIFGERAVGRGGGLSLCGEGWLGATEVTRQFVARNFPDARGDVMYRLHSASAHANTTLLFATAHEGSPGKATVTQDIDLIERDTLNVAAAWAAAQRNFYLYLGWAPQPFSDWLGLLKELAQTRTQGHEMPPPS